MLPNDLQLPESAVEEVEHGHVVYLTRGTERIAALAPPEVAAMSEITEDQIDLVLMPERPESLDPASR